MHPVNEDLSDKQLRDPGSTQLRMKGSVGPLLSLSFLEPQDATSEVCNFLSYDTMASQHIFSRYF